MLEDIKAVIAKNLPAEVGEQLRKRLEQADYLEKKLADANASLDATTATLRGSERDNTRLKETIAKAGELDKREAEVTKRENALAVTLAQKGADEAFKRADEIKELVSIIFRNPVIKKTVVERGWVPISTPSGVMQTPENRDTTTEERTEE